MAESLPRRSAGLGLRRALLDELIEAPAGAFDFLECAPDNWIGVGGVLGDKLETLASLGTSLPRGLRWAGYYALIACLFLFGGKQQDFIYFQF